MATQNQSGLTRRQRNRQRTIQTILDSAREIMREQGVAALSMHELARRVEMRPPSLYNYFSGLMDVYDSLFRLGFEQWDTHVWDYTKDAETWQDEIQLSMEAYLTFAMQNPDLFQLCFMRPVPGFVPSEESLEISLRVLGRVYMHFARLQEELDTDLSPSQLADLVIAITHGLTALHMANEPELPLGQGRFGSLIPATLAILGKAWSKPE